MFRKILNCFAIACAVSTLPYAVGVLRADPEGNCRRQCANYKCFVTLSPTDGKIAACMDYTDVFCHDASDDYCHPDIGCFGGGCEPWLEDACPERVSLRLGVRLPTA